MSLNIEKLFDIVFKYANEFRTKFPEGDGLKFWTSIKSVLAKYDNQESEWSNSITSGELHEQFYPIVMKLPEYYILGDGSKITDEANHFLIQVFRIPTVDSLTPRKLAQVALNLGQLAPKLAQLSDFNKKLIDQIRQSDLVDPRKFVSLPNLKKLEIPESVVSEVEKILKSQLKV